MKQHAKIERSLSKISHISVVMAHYRHGDLIDAEGMSYILEDVIEEIKEALEALEAKPVHKPANQAA